MSTAKMFFVVYRWLDECNGWQDEAHIEFHNIAARTFQKTILTLLDMKIGIVLTSMTFNLHVYM